MNGSAAEATRVLRVAALEALLAGVPLSERPFEALGQALGASEAEVLAAARELRADRELKSLGVLFDPTRLGYAGVLAAVSVPEESAEHVAGVLAEHPALTHVFERDDRYNVWCVVAAETELRALMLLDGALAAADVTEAIALPAERVMKLTVDFAWEAAPLAPVAAASSSAPAPTRERRALVRLLLAELPLVERPFRELAGTLAECGYDVDEGRALELVTDLASTGALKRIAGASATHRGALPVTLFASWPLTEGGSHCTVACEALTAETSVTHCYLVPTALVTRPTVATVLHAASRAEAEETLARLRAIPGLDAPRVTWGVREACRKPLRYFAEGEG